jgi:phosphoribosyl 1,2-cyclic phosphodiesterase
MTITVSVLGSGSRGNATFIKTGTTRLLIDAGLSRKELANRLEAIGEEPDGIDAVLITHEHNDHAAGLKSLAKELKIEAYLTWGTIQALKAEEYELNGSTLVPVTPGTPFKIGDAVVTAFRVPHDAREPVAFSVSCDGLRITQLTDVGHLPDTVAESLREADVLILESNHDLELLRVGPYPWNLKQRLLGRHGHLSNTAVARFLREQYDGRASHLMLAHLSEQNNHPELARQETLKALRSRALTSTVILAGQQQPTTPIHLS